MKIVKWVLGIGLALALFVGGMITQKKVGIGNLFKFADPNYVSNKKKDLIAAEHKGKLSIYILAGQSNMQGDGLMSEYKPVDSDGRVYVFNDSYLWQEGKEPVREKVGPSMDFAKQLIDSDSNEVVGIVNVAWGGTNIAQWEKSYDDHSLYQLMIKRALAASAQGEIKGFLFFQGENDGEGDSTDHFNDWDVHFQQFVQDVRADLHQENLPVVFAQIGKGEGEAWKKVKDCQERVKIPGVVMIKTEDLNYQNNTIHYTTESYQEIGKRFGQKFVQSFKK